MTAAQRERLRQLIDKATRRRIARAHLREEPWTDDPAYTGPKRRRPGRGSHV